MKAITKKDTECIIVSFSPIKEGTIMEGYAVIDKEAALKNKKKMAACIFITPLFPKALNATMTTIHHTRKE